MKAATDHNTYPIPGRPLTPSFLRGLFDVRVPRWVKAAWVKGSDVPKTYAELDERVWASLEPIECNRLADDVLVIFSRALKEPANAKYFDKSLSKASLLIPPHALGVSVRLANRLVAAGCVTDLIPLRTLSVIEFMKFRGVGVRTVLELMIVLEGITTGPVQEWVDQPTLPFDIEITPDAGGSRISCELRSVASRLIELPESRRINRSDPRFAVLCLKIVVEGETLQDICRSTLERASEFSSSEFTLHGLQALYNAVIASRHLTLEDELRSIAVASIRKADPIRMLSVVGWDGSGQKSLAEGGRLFGLSREGVRQMVSKVVEPIERHHNIYAPKLDKAVELLKRCTPCSARSFEIRLQTAGISSNRFQASGLLNAVSCLRGNLEFELQTIRNESFLVRRGDRTVSQVAIRCRKAASHWGVYSVTACAADFTDARGTPYTDLVRSTVEALDEFVWLDAEREWFWMPDGSRNPLLNEMRKILSVSSRIEVGLLREGVGRHHRRRGFVPPRSALLSLCDAWGQTRTEGSYVVSLASWDWQDVLEINEALMVSILREHEGILARPDFEAECVRYGMNRSTFFVYLNSSSVIVRYRKGVYGLRGVEIPTGLAEILSPMRTVQQVFKGSGWLDDGRYWVGIQLSISVVRSGVFGVPSALKEVIRGEYELFTSETSCGSLRAVGDRAWGLGPLIRRYSIQEGDVLLLFFDLRGKRVDVQWGGLEMLLDLEE